jgi:ion transport protein
MIGGRLVRLHARASGKSDSSPESGTTYGARRRLDAGPGRRQKSPHFLSRARTCIGTLGRLLSKYRQRSSVATKKKRPRWGTLGDALLTLFTMVTLEGWIDVMEKAMEVHAWAWIYFVTFIMIGTIIVLNLFIAIVITTSTQARRTSWKSCASPRRMRKC